MREFILGIITCAVIMGLLWWSDHKDSNDIYEQLINKMDEQVDAKVHAKLDSLKRMPIDDIISWVLSPAR